MRLLLRIVTAIAALALLVPLALFAWTIHLAHARASEAKRAFAARAERDLPLLLEAQARAAKLPFFTARRAGADAGPYLNPRIVWERSPLVPSRGSAPLALDDGLVRKFRAWGSSWTDHAGDVELAGLDFDWMGGLGAFGYWDLVNGSRLNEVRHPDFESLPLPNFLVLQDWAKLRLLRARREGDFAEAGAEIDQLAWLCYTTETLIGEAVAAGMLLVEAEAHDAFAKAGVDLHGWRAPTRADAELLRHAALGAISFAEPGVPAELMDRALASPIGHCAALAEQAGKLRLHRYLGATAPAAWSRELDHPIAPCRYSVARLVLAAGADLTDKDSIEAAFHLPRGGLGEKALARLAPNTTLEVLDAITEAPMGFTLLEQR